MILCREVEAGTMTEDIPIKPILSTVHFVFLSGTKVMKHLPVEEGYRLTTQGRLGATGHSG